VFTETLPRNGLHNPVILLFLGADLIQNSFSNTVAYLEVFTDPLPSNVSIKSVLMDRKIRRPVFSKKQYFIKKALHRDEWSA
jgi:hypothetical protein